MEKELALAFDFATAPKELQDVAERHKENFLRLEKAKAQLKNWQAELTSAQRDHSTTLKEFRSSIDTWVSTSFSEKEDAPEPVVEVAPMDLEPVR